MSGPADVEHTTDSFDERLPQKSQGARGPSEGDAGAGSVDRKWAGRSRRSRRRQLPESDGSVPEFGGDCPHTATFAQLQADSTTRGDVQPEEGERRHQVLDELAAETERLGLYR
jgi:hypothetical protein